MAGVDWFVCEVMNRQKWGVSHVVVYFFIWNIRNIKNIINKTVTYKWPFWNFLRDIRNIIMEH